MEDENNVKTVTVVGEAAEFLEPKKTRKNRKLKEEIPLIPTEKNVEPLINHIPLENKDSSNNDSNITSEIVKSAPLQAGTFNSTPKPDLPKSVTLTRKNHPAVLKPKLIKKESNKESNKQLLDNKVVNKPVIKVDKPKLPRPDPILENTANNSLVSNNVSEKNESEKRDDLNKEKMNKEHVNKDTRKKKFREKKITVNIIDNDPKTRKARKSIKKQVATMSIDEIKERLSKDGLINKNNKKIPEVMLRNMMKDSLLLASGK